MNIFLLLGFLAVFGFIVYHVVRLLIRHRLTETFITNESGQNRFFMDDEMAPFNKLNLNNRDSHWFLQRDVIPGKTSIQNLSETSPHRTDFYYVDENSLDLELPNPNTVKPRCSKLSFPHIKDRLTCVPEDHPVRPLVRHLQPYMFDEADLINYYDQALYRDWRYQRRPIDIRFAINPQKYCEQFPHVYPCFEYFRKY
jgi:hypothetical protein